MKEGYIIRDQSKAGTRVTLARAKEYDIDWIIKKIKDYFGKFVQTYSSERISYLLKTTENKNI